jgi:hypothetical protein
VNFDYSQNISAGTNAIAFWSEAKVKNNEPCRKDIYYNDGVIDRNLEDEIDINVRPSWNRSYRQSVHFLPSAINFEKVKNVIMELKINFQASKLSEKAEVLLDFDYSLK